MINFVKILRFSLFWKLSKLHLCFFGSTSSILGPSAAYSGDISTCSPPVKVWETTFQYRLYYLYYLYYLYNLYYYFYYMYRLPVLLVLLVLQTYQLQKLPPSRWVGRNHQHHKQHHNDKNNLANHNHNHHHHTWSARMLGSAPSSRRIRAASGFFAQQARKRGVSWNGHWYMLFL